MSRILAYKCNHCGSIIEDANEYRTHLRKEAAARRAQRNLDQKRKEWTDFLSGVSECSSFDDIARWFVDNGERILEVCYKNSCPDYGSRRRPGDGILSVEFFRMHWSDTCCNYHAAPAGKPTNWGGRDKNRPTSYPGWTGFLRVKMPEHHNFGSDVFKETSVHTGSGGGGGKGIYEYNVTLFAEEFPSLFVMEKLKGNLNG